MHMFVASTPHSHFAVNIWLYGDVDGNVGMLAVFRTKVRVSG